MRCTQWIGLSEKAMEYTRVHGDWTEGSTCPTCSHTKPSLLQSEAYDKTVGMFDEDYILYAYKMKDGRTLYEYVQAEPWSSGMVIFTALSWDKEHKDILQESLHSQEDIDNA